MSKTAGADHSLDSVGLITYLSGEMQFVKKPLRLTQKGHDFANILENSEVLNRLKSDFKNMTFDVILDSGKAIISAFAKKKLTELGLN
ncbi:hypothetical protein JQR61_003473 [Vibrio parahaemolyticus]|uniref:hypothetical protein n=1 Tax=Vibrio parahaemolyticus TaxID=670 RepID=UPI000AFF8C89|nr:hypothetical protein [Vibrio parahaemolyticus]EHD7139759.1 hypothetical protein [Vibrio parahaemolyticus]EJG2160845.1 hypothetical protein [Vibrio parahaemolyticus]EJU9076698.1 hypothetical protein [Vibrio parahaemolyticus]ELC0725408.1 hypothetical protein [Vibrio parahaemolyticus]HAS6945306.1 hypothetical protein [Vibrio parahaemolyticus]